MKCSNCGAEWDGEKHTCPYAEDIHNDSDTMCDCCPSCEHNCAMDI